MNGRGWTDIVLPGDASKRVTSSENFKTSMKHLAVHPYNSVDPERSVWWLFPPSRTKPANWPAYHHGKFMFDKPAGRGAVRAGLHVEKGLGREQAKAFGQGRGATFELTTNWIWHQFVRDLQGEAFRAALDDIEGRSGLGVELDISVGAPLDEPGLSERYSDYLFRYKGAGNLESMSVSERKQRVEGLAGCRTLSDLGRAMEASTTTNPWNWINLVAGCCIPTSRPVGGADRAWGGAEIWELILEPLQPWVR